METTERGGPADRVSARRALLFLLAALAAGLAASLIYAGLLEWVFHEIQAGQSATDLLELLRTVGHVTTAVWLLAGIAVAVGCALLARASRTRVWTFVAMAAAIVGIGLTVAPLALQRGDGVIDPATLRLLTAIGIASSLVEWVAIGLAVRGVMRAAGHSVSAGVIVTWLLAIAVELFLGLARVGLLADLFAWDEARLLFHGLSTAAVVARLILLAAARRGLAAGAPSSAEGTAPLAADEPSSPAAAGALGLYRAGLITHVSVTVLGAVIAVLSGLSGSAPGALLAFLAVPELIAAALVVVGLFRLGALPPAAVARFAGVCVLVAVAIQAYATSIVWRLTAYAERAASGSWGGMSLSDAIDMSERLPALELGGTVISLVGFLSVAAALHAAAGWLGRPALGARAVALSVGVSFIALLAGCLRLYVSTAQRPTLGVVMPMAIAAMVIGLVLFVSYVGVLGQMIERLRGAGATLPAARVVNDGRDPGPPAA